MQDFPFIKKRQCIHKPFSLIIFCLLICFNMTVHAQSPIVIGYNQDLVPSYYWNEAKTDGIDAEIIDELFRRSGLTYELKFMPWARVMMETRSGVIDAACTGFKTPERESFAFFLDQPIHHAVFSIFVRRGESFPFDGLKDLHGRVVGINRGYSISPDENAPEHKGKIIIRESESAEQNLRLLLAGRIDVYAGNRDSVLYIAEQMGIISRIEVLPIPLSGPRPHFFMLSKAADIENKNELINKLNWNLTEMAKDGTLKSIIEKYLNQPTFLD